MTLPRAAVRAVLDELVDEVAVRRMQLDAVEARRLRRTRAARSL
jgi:hypothetical protein